MPHVTIITGDFPIAVETVDSQNLTTPTLHTSSHSSKTEFVAAGTKIELDLRETERVSFRRLPQDFASLGGPAPADDR